jgi:trehalose synthase
MSLSDLSPDRFDEILPPQSAAHFAEQLAKTRSLLDGHTFWHVNSASAGGGVAEMLESVLGYVRGAGIETRWLVIDGGDEFFTVTKRIHHLLHGESGDGGPLGDAERAIYEDTLAHDAAEVAKHVQVGDVVVLHDPQTLGLAPLLREAGAALIWSCHVGADQPNDGTRLAWDFLRPYVAATGAQVFSRGAYRWEGLDDSRVAVIPPCIDAFSAKNQALSPETVRAILYAAGVATGMNGGRPRFVRRDGSDGKVCNQAQMIEREPLPMDARVVTQVSRWDPLKDHQDVMNTFVQHIAERTDAHLVLAGPAPQAVSDDPEGEAVLEELREGWAALHPEVQQRVHIACLPMADIEENAAIVNALQRHADVIVQKSLAEGFGLTVAEAMWKGRPVVGSRVGGIQDQIDNGVSGRLVDDPADLAAVGDAVIDLLDDPERSRKLGSAAHQRVVDDYLAPRYLTSFLELVGKVSEPQRMASTQPASPPWC